MHNNDYENAIKIYLRRYLEWKRHLDHLQQRIEELDAMIRLEAVPKTTRYEYTGGGSGGWEKPSTEEAECMRKEKMREDIKGKRAEHEKLEKRLQALEEDMDALPDAEREILQFRFVQGESWDSVAARVNRSNSCCRSIGRKAIESMTRMYFGDDSVPKQGSVFLPCGQVDKNVDNCAKD